MIVGYTILIHLTSRDNIPKIKSFLDNFENPRMLDRNFYDYEVIIRTHLKDVSLSNHRVFVIKTDIQETWECAMDNMIGRCRSVIKVILNERYEENINRIQNDFNYLHKSNSKFVSLCNKRYTIIGNKIPKQSLWSCLKTFALYGN